MYYVFGCELNRNNKIARPATTDGRKEGRKVRGGRNSAQASHAKDIRSV